MFANSTDKRSFRWRISLGGLMLAIAAIAVVIWLFSWSWDIDEQIVLALWLLSVVLGLVYGLCRGRYEVLASTLLACIIPVAGFWLYHV
jgi:hypothetical protein